MQSNLKFPIDHSVNLIQKKILKKHRPELKKFSATIGKLLEKDIELFDELTLLPEAILRSAIEETLLWALAGEREYFVAYEDGGTKEI